MSQTKKMAIIGTLAVIIILGSYMGYAVYGSGKLSVSITDPPRDWGEASNIYIRFSEIEIHRANAGNETGWYNVVDEGGWVDLRSTLNSSSNLGVGDLRAGKYNLLRFTVMEAVITVNGENHTVSVQSGRLKVSIVQGDIDIKASKTSYVLIDVTPKVVGSAAQGYRVVPAAKAFPTQG